MEPNHHFHIGQFVQLKPDLGPDESDQLAIIVDISRESGSVVVLTVDRQYIEKQISDLYPLSGEIANAVGRALWAVTISSPLFNMPLDEIWRRGG